MFFFFAKQREKNSASKTNTKKMLKTEIHEQFTRQQRWTNAKMNGDAWVGLVETGVCKYRTTTVKWLIPKEMRDEGGRVRGEW